MGGSDLGSTPTLQWPSWVLHSSHRISSRNALWFAPPSQPVHLLVDGWVQFSYDLSCQITVIGELPSQIHKPYWSLFLCDADFT